MREIFHHVGAIYGHDISNELQKKINLSIPKPEYTEDVQQKQINNVELINLQSARLSEEREAKRVMLTQAEEDWNDLEAPTKLAILENEIDEATFKASIDPEIHPAFDNET